MSDFLFTEQARALAQLHIKNGYPAYVYEFNVVPPEDAGKVKGAAHGDGLCPVFRHVERA